MSRALSGGLVSSGLLSRRLVSSRLVSSRLVPALLVLSISTIAGLAGTAVSPDAPDAANTSNASPMRFALFAEGPAEACSGKCRPLIAASGMITADTPRQFLAFVRENALQASQGAPAGGEPAATVVLESDGGSVLGALDFGRAIRRLGFATTVGHVVERRSKTGTRYGEATGRADCQSMCTFVLLGGVQRQVPSDARVLVHQIWLGDRREDAVAANYSAEDLVVVQRDIGSIMQYTIEMGGDIDLVALSLKVPPWEPMRALSREEMRRTRLDLTVEIAALPASSKTAAGPSVADDDAQWSPVNGRGWVTVTRAGQPALARNHPLTFEGERIGSFDLFFACGSVPETFTLTYRETRFGPADRGLPRSVTQVALMIDDQVQPLRIAASEKKTRRGELESVASAVLPARLVRLLAADNPASMTLETESIGNPRTVIRVGNAGFGRSFRDLEKGCRDGRPRGDTRAQAQ
jgi:hypothetical protein